MDVCTAPQALLFARLLLATLIAGIIALSPMRPVHAASITVTTTADELNRDGDCSLREAIRAANTDAAVDRCPAGSGADSISIPSGVFALSRAGAKEDDGEMGDLDITADVTITGAGSSTVLDGLTLDRLFDVHAPARARISRMLLRNGYVGPENGGGLRNQGTLTLSQMTITASTADLGFGGGIWNAGTLDLVNSTVSANQSVSPQDGLNSGGGLGNHGVLRLRSSSVRGNQAEHEGGGIWNEGTLELVSSSVEANRSSYGGGIANLENGQVLLNGSTVKGNSSTAGGGGVYNYNSLTLTRSTVSGNRAAEGGGVFNIRELIVRFSTISDNSALGDGGGILNGPFFTPATLTMSDSTISGNTAFNDGGGLFHRSSQAPSVLHNVTVANNSADGDTSGRGDGGGIYSGHTTLSLANTIVAANRDRSGQAPDCVGTFNSRGYNLVQQTAGCTISGMTTGNVFGRSARLATLASNGGTTRTHLPLADSPALDAGNPGAPSSSGDTCRPNDQRDVTRPQDGNGDGAARCDIGAVELRPAVSLSGQEAQEGIVDQSSGQQDLDAQPEGQGDVEPASDAPTPAAEPLTPTQEPGGEGAPLSVDTLPADTGCSLATFIDAGTWDALGDGCSAGAEAEAAEVPVDGASIMVTTTGDELNSDGDCSLREAIRAANWNLVTDACPAGSGADLITLPAGTFLLTRAGTNEEASATGDLDITADVTISGVGPDLTLIDGGGLDRVLEVHGNWTRVTLLNMTLRNGSLTETQPGFTNGAGLRSRGNVTVRGVAVKTNRTTGRGGGGGVLNVGTMALERCTISDNVADYVEQNGGGISNLGSMQITRCSIARNAAVGVDSNAGGIANGGRLTIAASTIAENRGEEYIDAIYNWGTLTMVDSTVRRNQGTGQVNIQNQGTATIRGSVIVENNLSALDDGAGGVLNYGTMSVQNSLIGGNGGRGILSFGGILTLSNSTVVGNGGGIENSSRGAMTITGSTISGNRTARPGGGINNVGGTLNVTNSTISGNRAGRSGGGINNTSIPEDETELPGVVTLNNVTVAENSVGTAGDGGGLHNEDYGRGNRIRLRNSIVGNNQDAGGEAPDCSGPLSSYGYNLVESAKGCSLGNITTGNKVGVDPRLGPLASNGGSTKTHALLTGSPAIDAANPGAPGSGSNTCPTTDQRAYRRPRDGDGNGTARCDIGAVERQSATAVLLSDGNESDAVPDPYSEPDPATFEQPEGEPASVLYLPFVAAP